MRVRGKKKIDRIGLIRLGRRFGITPVDVDSLKRGNVVEVPDAQGEALIARGYVYRVAMSTPITDLRMDDRNIETVETVVVEKDEDDEDEDEDEYKIAEDPDRDLVEDKDILLRGSDE